MTTIAAHPPTTLAQAFERAIHGASDRAAQRAAGIVMRTDIMPPIEHSPARVVFRADEHPARTSTVKGIEYRPDVGWYAACAACGHNLTSHHGEYVAWHDKGDTAGCDSDADGWDGEDCPSCGAPFGEAGDR